jgi:pimeloyl-ACP methyl ester carboxylesterase
MQWRKAAAVGGAALGAAALYNAAARRGLEPLKNPLGGETGEFLWRGHRIAYTRHGAGSPVLLVHGIYAGASSFEWRNTVPGLLDHQTVFTVDLLGFGRSDRPDVRYTPGLYQALLADVITRVVQEPCAVVASGLSAAQLIALAARDPRPIAALALIAPTGVAHQREADVAAGGAAHLLLDAPIVGNAVYNGLTSPTSVRRSLEMVYADDRLVTNALVETHVNGARQPGGKHPIAALMSGRSNVDVRAALRRVRQPALLLWGELACQNSVEHAHAFRVIKRDFEWALIQDAGDLPHAERPNEANAILRSFLERARRESAADGPRLVMA